MSVLSLRRKLLPDYAVIPVVLWVIGQVLAFYATRFLNLCIYGSYENFFDISISLDNIIPVVPQWIYIYILTYVFWVVSFVLICRNSKEMCCKALSAEMLGKLVCAIIFVSFPTFVIRPEIKVNDLSTFLLDFIYKADTPDNLFPSMHCSISYFATRYIVKCERVQKWYKVLSVVMTVLVCFSVVFTKQHVVIDIVGGIAVAEICSQLSDRLKLYRVYYKLDLGKRYERKHKNENN